MPLSGAKKAIASMGCLSNPKHVVLLPVTLGGSMNWGQRDCLDLTVHISHHSLLWVSSAAIVAYITTDCKEWHKVTISSQLSAFRDQHSIDE
jgi:hypothetical protein